MAKWPLFLGFRFQEQGFKGLHIFVGFRVIGFRGEGSGFRDTSEVQGGTTDLSGNPADVRSY